MPQLSDFEASLIREMPMLRKYAIKLCRRNYDLAEDLVQEAVCRALQHRDSFDGSNIGAWLVTILRNYHRSDYRKHKLMVEDPGGVIALNVPCKDDPVDRILARQLLQSVMSLPSAVTEPLLKVAGGATYEEAADECMICEGTVKSRISRARALLIGG